MCGIVGVFHRQDGPPVSRTIIERMCDSIVHRGPDDVGLFVEGRCGLGVRRLSIIDLDGGHQPVFNESGTSAIVLNGEIYNYRDLRRDLVAQGHQLRTKSDTEPIIHLYEDMGARCVERLRGMFAFAVWDGQADTLLLARDRFGIKPLYVVQSPWGIAFASELKALVAAGMTDRNLDWNALDMFFQLGYIPAPHSPFLDVKKLEPGHTLEWRSSGEVTVRRYWDLPPAQEMIPDRIEERVLSWLDDSVKAHMVSDVPVAVLLSGGLDSSAVVSSMAIGGYTPHAFTARYHGSGAPQADETGLARELADRYGVQLTVVDVHPNIERIFEPVVWALDEPHADESAIPMWLIAEAVGESYKVALAGTGGDELFAGYRRHIGLLIGEHYGKLPAPLRRILTLIVNSLREPSGSGLGVDRLKRFVRTNEREKPDRFLGYFSRLPDETRAELYHPDIASQMNGTSARTHFRALHQRGGAFGGLRAGLYLDYKTYLPDDVLALTDRIAMAHSLEVRVPFVDHEFVTSVFPLADRIKVGLWRNKRLLKRALRPRLPRAHLRAPKRGFVGPTAAWLRNELRTMLTDELAQERLARLGYFDHAVANRFLKEHLTHRHNREGILWELMCFSTWHRQYVEPPSVRYLPS